MRRGGKYLGGSSLFRVQSFCNFGEIAGFFIITTTAYETETP